MNNLLIGGSLAAGLIFLLYRFGLGYLVNQTIQNTDKQDKSLQQQQLENQAKLAQVKKQLDELYKEKDHLHENDNKTDQEKADSWNKPSGQS